MTLKVKGEGLGAQVTGVDPKNLDDITTDEIRDIVYTNKLVVLKDVHPSPREFIKLGRIIGQIVPYYEPMYHHEDHPEIFVSSTEEGQGSQKPARSGISTICLCRNLSRFPWCCRWRCLDTTAGPISSISPGSGSRCPPPSETRPAEPSAPTTLDATSRSDPATSTGPSERYGTRSTGPRPQ